MHPVETALSLFSQRFTCSQAILLAFAPRFGLDPLVAARLASGFGAGIARQGQVCGAIAGAVMVLGLYAGNAAPDDTPSKEAAYAKVRTLMKRFADEHGSTECRVLTGYDLSTPDGHAAAIAAGVFTEKCPAFVRSAATILSDLLG